MMNELLLGIATADITPPVGALLVGYGLRESASAGHPLRPEDVFGINPSAGNGK